MAQPIAAARAHEANSPEIEPRTPGGGVALRGTDGASQVGPSPSSRDGPGPASAGTNVNALDERLGSARARHLDAPLQPVPTKATRLSARFEVVCPSERVWIPEHRTR